MPVELKTDSALLARLQAAARHEVTKQELRRQRVSFIYGNLPNESQITKHQVEAAIARIEGETVAA